MNADERRAVGVAVALLLLSSLLRFGWEVRSAPPLLPPDTTAYAGLVEGTRAAVAAEERRRTPLGPGERVDPNRDPEVELARLPGVGPALAARIVRSRETEGPFLAPEELTRVQGVGPATLERLRPHLDLDAPPPPPPGTGAGGGEGVGPPGDRVAVNRADASGLEALPGVGPALAARIVEDRSRNGPYQRPEDLLRVPGIGPATLERFRGRLLLP
jgi:competence protein ComEA